MGSVLSGTSTRSVPIEITPPELLLPESTVPFSSGSVGTETETDPEHSPIPPHPPTPMEINVVRQNVENYCSSNPNLDQFIESFGGFSYQIQPNEVTDEIRETLLESVSSDVREYIEHEYLPGVRILDLCGNLFIWDNHLAICARDNRRVLAWF